LVLGKNPKARIILTTSPVPIARTFQGKDILVANSFAKSILRTVAGVVADSHDMVDYFPSYEIAMLTRDPSIWVDDLIHLSDDFVGRIVMQLIGAYMPGWRADVDVVSQAWTELRAGNRERALSLLESAPSDRHEHACMRALAIFGSERGGFELLAASAAEAELTHNQAERVAAILYQGGRYDLTQKVAERALALPGGLPDSVAFLQAVLAVAQAKLGSPKAEITMASALESRRTGAVLNLAGQLAMMSNRPQDAARFYSETVSMLDRPGGSTVLRGEAYLGLAEVAGISGDRSEAERLLKLSKQETPAHRRVAEVERAISQL
jgi:hypothetical protein